MRPKISKEQQTALHGELPAKVLQHDTGRLGRFGQMIGKSEVEGKQEPRPRVAAPPDRILQFFLHHTPTILNYWSNHLSDGGGCVVL